MTVIGPLYMSLTARAVGITGRDVSSALAGVARATAVTGAALVALRVLLVHDGVPPVLRLLAVAAAGTVVYAAAVWLLAPDVVAEVSC